MVDKYGGKPYLEQRALKPFEKLMIEELGGREIFNKYLNKDILKENGDKIL